jgi:hypothetical protein
MQRATRIVRGLVRGGYPALHADAAGGGSPAPPDGHPLLTAVLGGRFGPAWLRENCAEVRQLAQDEATRRGGVRYAEPAGTGGPAGGGRAATAAGGGPGGGGGDRS